MTNNKPFNRYKIETTQRLITSAFVIDRETGDVVASGETVLSPNDTNDPKLGREIATGRAFKQLLRNVPLTTESSKRLSFLAGKIEGIKKGFEKGEIRGRKLASQSDQAEKVYAFLEGVAVGHAQHPEISRHIAQQDAIPAPPAPPAPSSPLLLASPPSGPCSRLSYEPGERVRHSSDGCVTSYSGTVIGKHGDGYMVDWGVYGKMDYLAQNLMLDAEAV